MRVLLVAATEFEIAPFRLAFKEQERQPFHYQFESITVEILITGVGLPLAAFALGHRLANKTYDLLLQAGVAGAIDRSLSLGEVVQVVSDCFADLGVQEADGTFTSMHELGLIPAEQFPFKGGRLWLNAKGQAAFLPTVHGVSVNRVHGEEASIEAFAKQYPFGQVESMEGASFAYAALQHGITAIQIRGISNYVERRQREGWELEKAIQNLNAVLVEMIGALAEQQGVD